MGTRSNILIEYGSTKIFLYRHWDGYPEVTGYDLARILSRPNEPDKKLGWAGTFLTRLLEQDDYELTTDLHGDIEYLYQFNFSTTKPACRIRVYDRGDWSGPPSGECVLAYSKSQSHSPLPKGEWKQLFNDGNPSTFYQWAEAERRKLVRFPSKEAAKANQRSALELAGG